jgi:hypothetical protein
MATTSRIGQPGRKGHWGLTVDRMINPSKWIIIRYPDDGKRHADPYEVVAEVLYGRNPDVEVTRLIDAGMPKGTAMSLIFQVEAKRSSPKAAEADLGYRPVS